MTVTRVTPRICRLTKAAASRRLAECDALPGMAPDVWDRQKAAAEHRMAVVDAQPPGWKALLNDYHHNAVAHAADRAGDPETARRLLERRFGTAI